MTLGDLIHERVIAVENNLGWNILYNNTFNEWNHPRRIDLLEYILAQLMYWYDMEEKFGEE